MVVSDSKFKVVKRYIFMTALQNPEGWVGPGGPCESRVKLGNAQGKALRGKLLKRKY